MILNAGKLFVPHGRFISSKGLRHFFFLKTLILLIESAPILLPIFLIYFEFRKKKNHSIIVVAIIGELRDWPCFIPFNRPL